MTLAELIARYRILSGDRAEPYLVGDADVTTFINDAVRQACIRARLIHESANPIVCAIDVSAGVAAYPLAASLYEIDHLSFVADTETRRVPLKLASPEWMDDHVADWRSAEGAPRYALQNDDHIRLVPRPDADGTLQLEGYRMPLAPLALPDDAPEIHAAHHPHLVDWVLHQVFSTPDSEYFDPERADAAEARFTRYFGPMPDADLRRITREDVPNVVAPFLP